MSYCTNCGKPLQPGDRFCGGCGLPVNQAIIPPLSSGDTAANPSAAATISAESEIIPPIGAGAETAAGNTFSAAMADIPTANIPDTAAQAFIPLSNQLAAPASNPSASAYSPTGNPSSTAFTYVPVGNASAPIAPARPGQRRTMIITASMAVLLLTVVLLALFLNKRFSPEGIWEFDAADAPPVTVELNADGRVWLRFTDLGIMHFSGLYWSRSGERGIRISGTFAPFHDISFGEFASDMTYDPASQRLRWQIGGREFLLKKQS